MKTSIIITSKEANTEKKRKRSFSDINPNATNDELKNFALAVNSLTTNQYVETNRVDTTNVDSEDSQKGHRDLSISNYGVNQTAEITFNIVPEETVSPTVFYYANSQVSVLTTTQETSETTTIAKFTCQIPNTTGVIYIALQETENFYSAYVRQVIDS